MAAFLEFINVIVRNQAIAEKYPGGIDSFINDVPNKTFCTDGELSRVGFMGPVDVEEYVTELQELGLAFLDKNGHATDIVVADTLFGPSSPCDWVECGQVSLATDPGKSGPACRMLGSQLRFCAVPKMYGGTDETLVVEFVPYSRPERRDRLQR